MTQKIVFFFAFVLTIIFVTGCRNYADFTENIADNLVVIPVSPGGYRSVVWVDENLISFLYSPTPQNDVEGVQPLLYDFELEEEQLIALPISKDTDNCRKPGVRILERLPNGNLGFIERCFFGDEVTGEAYTLFIWDVETQTIIRSFPYPANFTAWAFSFAPDMSRFTQERGIGAGLNNEIYASDLDGNKEQLVQEFKRARAPAWSPDGSTIAFVGTESYNATITSFGDIEDLLYHPWDVYLMNADGTNLRLILPGIQDANDLKWLPGKNQLSFTGVFQKKEGIWVFDLDTQKMMRIWPYQTSYDWSPDRTKMVVIANDVKDQQYPHPVIVEMPDDFLEQTP